MRLDCFPGWTFWLAIFIEDQCLWNSSFLQLVMYFHFSKFLTLHRPPVQCQLINCLIHFLLICLLSLWFAVIYPYIRKLVRRWIRMLLELRLLLSETANALRIIFEICYHVCWKHSLWSFTSIVVAHIFLFKEHGIQS